MSDEKTLLEELAEIGESVEPPPHAEPSDVPEDPEPKIIEHIDGQEKLIPDDIVWHGGEELRSYLVPIDSLADHPQNPNVGDAIVISASLERWGQTKPIVHDDGTLVAGHHVRAAGRLLDWTHIAAVEHKFDSDEARLAYLLADNKIAKLAVLKAVDEYGLLMDLEAAGYAEVPGYGIDERETLQEQAGMTPTQAGTEWEETAGESPEAAAARQAAIAQYEQHREVVLLLTYPEQYELFGQHVRSLMKVYGTTGTVATIARAVAEAAAAVAERDVPADAE